jgi:hypothetical protein
LSAGNGNGGTGTPLSFFAYSEVGWPGVGDGGIEPGGAGNWALAGATVQSKPSARKKSIASRWITEACAPPLSVLL